MRQWFLYHGCTQLITVNKLAPLQRSPTNKGWYGKQKFQQMWCYRNRVEALYFCDYQLVFRLVQLTIQLSEGNSLLKWRSSTCFTDSTEIAYIVLQIRNQHNLHLLSTSKQMHIIFPQADLRCEEQFTLSPTSCSLYWCDSRETQRYKEAVSDICCCVIFADNIQQWTER